VVILLILVLSCVIFRGLGFAGIAAFATWQMGPYLINPVFSFRPAKAIYPC
jgi:hypothetical protein